MLSGGLAAGLAPGVTRATSGFAMSSSAIIDDFSQAHPLAANGARWQAFSDNVMGGVSQARMAREAVGRRPALRLTGAVRLENNGGFVQAALDLAPDAGSVDARGWSGIELDVFGPPESYGLHLRTADLTRPWQSYRQGFATTPAWRTVRLPFAGFTPYRTETALDLSRLRRLGVIAIGRAFEADVAVAGLRFYR
jgi:adhesin HecA-like repeat protein